MWTEDGATMAFGDKEQQQQATMGGAKHHSPSRRGDEETESPADMNLFVEDLLGQMVRTHAHHLQAQRTCVP